MSEVAAAVSLIRNLPANAVIQYPSGRWGFAGKVQVDLAYTRADGSPLTDKDIENVRSFGPRLAHVKSVTFATEQQAIAALEEKSKRFRPKAS